MTPFERITGIVAPLDRLNVDTDQYVVEVNGEEIRIEVP